MEDLYLQQRSQESRSRAWQDDSPTPAEEKTKRKKQVRFDTDGELGNEPPLLLGLTLFLVEGMAKE